MSHKKRKSSTMWWNLSDSTSWMLHTNTVGQLQKLNGTPSMAVAKTMSCENIRNGGSLQIKRWSSMARWYKFFDQKTTTNILISMQCSAQTRQLSGGLKWWRQRLESSMFLSLGWKQNMIVTSRFCFNGEHRSAAVGALYFNWVYATGKDIKSISCEVWPLYAFCLSGHLFWQACSCFWNFGRKRCDGFHQGGNGRWCISNLMILRASRLYFLLYFLAFHHHIHDAGVRFDTCLFRMRMS